MAPSDSTSIMRMPHRFLGNSGLLVSRLALGSWMDFDEKYTAESWYEMMATAFKHGVNFFDNAEGYGGGQAERNMGAAVRMGIADGIWSREDLVLTTKIFISPKSFVAPGPNNMGLSRKHIVEGTKASLDRLQLDYVDVIFIRPEPFTPMEEIVRAMNFVIDQGWTLYWGTSQWTSADILEACEIAERLGLVRPIAEQTVYNLLERNKVEFEFADLYGKYKLGLTTWSPLSFGTLTGKYSTSIPEGSRMTNPRMRSYAPDLADRVAKAEKLKPIAKELDCSMAALAVAWCLANDKVSTVLIGAKTPTQLEENLMALEVVSKITTEMKTKMEELVPFVPKVPGPDEHAVIRAQFL